jgi:hypothetical protein
MSNTKKLTASELHTLLESDYNLGKLYYKARGIPWWDTRYSGKECFNTDSHGYLVGTLHKNRYLKHRVIWCMKYGYWPEELDHIDRDKYNNSILNLREVTHTDNQRNYPAIKSNTSGQTGVHYRKREKLWVAYIGNGHKTESLGYFKFKKDAVNARLAKELEYGYTRGREGV